MIDNIIKPELQSSAINESDYILHNSTNPTRYPILSTLNEIIIEDSYGD